MSSLGALVAASETAAEAAEAAARAGQQAAERNQKTVQAAKERIQALQHPTPGIAARPGSTAPSPAQAAKNAAPAKAGSSSFLSSLDEGITNPLNLFPGAGILAKVPGTVEDLTGGLAGQAASAAAEPVAEGLVNIVKPIALKTTLYAVLILGGIILAGYGLTTAIRPEPPKLKLRTVAKAAAAL